MGMRLCCPNQPLSKLKHWIQCRLDLTRLQISEAVIGDNTGSILLSLRNDQIAMVQEGKCYTLRNAKIDMVASSTMRVAVDRWGLIEALDGDQEDLKINEKEQNLSTIEYELVSDNGNKGKGKKGKGRGGRGKK